MGKKKIALVYDRVNKWGGAERVLLALQDLYPNAALFTSLYSTERASWAQKFPNIFTSYLQKVPYLRNKHQLLGTVMPILFESFNFDKYDVVISVTSEAAKGIITRGYTKHICYCLTPTRYLWSHYDTYFKSKSFKLFTKPIINYLRRWDKVAAQRPDLMVAISTEVQSRIKKYYDRESIIIHPPLTPLLHSIKAKHLPNKKNYYLVVSRLVPYKKVDLVINAFNDLGFPLIIIGTGGQEKTLKKMAKKNIKFLGYLTDEKLAYYYENAKALIFPQEEDFGLVAIEAQSFGVPVIAYKKGGSLDIVKEGETGIFFSEQNVASLINAIKKFNKVKFDVKIIKGSVKKFSKENFEKRFRQLVGQK